MQFPRLPRFKRGALVAPMQLTERDHDIIRLVHQHRFLRSWQIASLIGSSTQQLLRRLQLLYHHGYLERPRAQIDYYHHGGTRSLIYGVGNKGGAHLQRESGRALPKLSWGEKNRSVRGMFLEHAILVSDVMVAIELACREKGNIRILTDEQILRDQSRPIQWKVKVNSTLKLGVIPDRVFALEFSNLSGERNRGYFFLEADRGTMPVKRRHLYQTSFYRKLLAYEATWSQSMHQKKFGFNRFRVLIVTTSKMRVNSMIEACSTLKRGHGLFLFADQTILKNPSDIFSPIWKTCKKGETASLLS